MVDELTPTQTTELQNKPIRVQVKNEVETAQEGVATKRTGMFARSRQTLRRAAGALRGKRGQEDKEQREVRKQMTKIASQGVLTINVLQKNNGVLEDISKENEQVAQLLGQLDDNTVSSLNDISQKLADGEEISASEAKFFTTQFENMTQTLDDVGVKLSIDLRDIAKETGELIQNESLSLEDRRKILDQTVKQLSEASKNNQLSELQNQKLAKLESISNQQTNISGDLLADTSKLLADLGDDTTQIKTEQTLRELNSNLDAFVLSQDEMKSAMEKQTESGKSMKEVFQKGLKSQLAQGALGFGMSALGLGGLEQILPVETLARGGGRLLGRAGRGLAGRGRGVLGRGRGMVGRAAGAGRGLLGAGGGLLGRAGGALGKVGVGGLLKGGAKILGKVALPLAAITSAFDFIEGFSNAADIAGVDPEKLDFGTKFQAGVASALSGLTFGLVDPKTIFGGIDKGIEFLFGDDGILTKAGRFFKQIFFATPIGMIFKNFGAIKDGIAGLFSEEGILGKAGSILKKIFSVTPIGMIINLLTDFEGSMNALFGEEGILTKATEFLGGIASKVGGFFGIGGDDDAEGKEEGGVLKSVGGFFGFGDDEPTTRPTGVGGEAKMDTRTADISAEEAGRERAAREAMAEGGGGKVQVVPMPVEQPSQKQAPSKVTQVDDSQLMIMNSALLE